MPTSPSAATGATALTAGTLSGTWQLVDIQPAGQAVQPRPATATYNLTFENDRASARADCNVCGGSVTISGQTVTIGPAMACTRAACPTMEFESVYESILGGDSNAVVQSTSLTLSSARGVLRYQR